MKYLLTGGFLSGYRTYVVGFGIALQAVLSWAIGDATLAQLIEQLPQILGGLGFVTVRAGIANTLADLVREVAKSPVDAPMAASKNATTLRSSALGGAICLLFALTLAGCIAPPNATARERLFSAETTYAAVVNSAAIAVEAGQLSPDQIETFATGKALVRMALDDATEFIKNDDEIGAVTALSSVPGYLNELALILEARSDE